MGKHPERSIEIPDDVDPEEFLRKLLEVSPEDGEEAREQAAKDVESERDD